MKARIENGIVVEILNAIPGFSIEECFHPSILNQCVDFVEGMEVGKAIDSQASEEVVVDETKAQ